MIEEKFTKQYRETYNRQILLLGEENQEKIKNTQVAVFGAGGVGSYTIEAFARNGIENILVVDRDIVDRSNINRQLVAYKSTIGKKKVDIVKQRVLDINEESNIQVRCMDIQTEEDLEKLFSETFIPEYIIDAVDDIKAKLALIQYAVKNNIQVIVSTGAGNRVNPTKIRIKKIYETKNCPLAKRLRKELKQIEKKQKVEKGKILKFKNVLAVYSEEIPQKAKEVTMSLMQNTATFGIFISAYVLNKITGKGMY